MAALPAGASPAAVQQLLGLLQASCVLRRAADRLTMLTTSHC